MLEGRASPGPSFQKGPPSPQGGGAAAPAAPPPWLRPWFKVQPPRSLRKILDPPLKGGGGKGGVALPPLVPRGAPLRTEWCPKKYPLPPLPQDATIFRHLVEKCALWAANCRLLELRPSPLAEILGPSLDVRMSNVRRQMLLCPGTDPRGRGEKGGRPS